MRIKMFIVLGVVILHMVLQKLPKFTNSLQGMYIIGTEGLAQYIPPSVSPELKDFLINCLKVIPEQRLPASELLDVSSNVFFLFSSIHLLRKPALERTWREL